MRGSKAVGAAAVAGVHVGESASAPSSQCDLDAAVSTDFDFETLKVGGLKLQCYATCRRKLWLYSHHVTFDSHSSASRETERQAHNENRRTLSLDGIIEVDVLDDGTVVGVKPAGAPVAATRLQLAYYTYYLRRRGLGGVWGELRLPPDGRRERVRLTAHLARQVEEALRDIRRLELLSVPSAAMWRAACRECPYAGMCWA